MRHELSYFLDWDWSVVWDYGQRQRLSFYLAKKGKEYCYLESFNCCIYITFMKKGVAGYIKTKPPIKCRTHLELDNVKHILLNEGFTVRWHVYQWILEMFTEHYKVYSPYIPDKQQEYFINEGGVDVNT